MATHHIYIAPFAAGILFIAIPITTYIMSIYMGHLRPIFPYISDTGALPPESCIFSQLSNMLAALILVSVWVRYEQLAVVLRSNARFICTSLGTQNRAAFWVGVFSSFGASLIANFQITSSVYPFHVMGVILGVGGMSVYSLLQALISAQTKEEHSALAGSSNARVQLIIAIIVGTTNTVFIVFFILSYMNFETTAKIVDWKPGDTGFYLHLASTVSEWTCDFAVGAFFLTMAREFHSIRMESPVITMHPLHDGQNETSTNGYTDTMPPTEKDYFLCKLGSAKGDDSDT